MAAAGRVEEARGASRRRPPFGWLVAARFVSVVGQVSAAPTGGLDEPRYDLPPAASPGDGPERRDEGNSAAQVSSRGKGAGRGSPHRRVPAPPG